MGEVYRARDTKLGRDVAIKVLLRSFTADPDRLARFEREARLLASLNHANIGAIYGLEEAGEIRGLVLELVEGPTLAERIARGPLPLREVLQIARQIAEALEAAHDRGIIHRDLKPANIKLTPDGQVKVLDFGLAKVRDEPGAVLDAGHAPTTMATVPGAILGTVPYMAPEQANGRDADRSSDVWTFGCVLFEMLTGRRAFGGESAGEVIANVLRADPDWEQLPAETPEEIRRLLRRTLQKDHKARFRDIRDARLEIEEVQQGVHRQAGGPARRSSRREKVMWLSALVLVAAIAAALASAFRAQATVPELRLDIATPPTMDPSVALAPDGRKLVYAVRARGQSQLWLRLLDSESAVPLRGTDRASAPFWSPDSRSIGFFADARLKRLDIDAGSVKTIVAVTPSPLGGAWNSDGTIIFSMSPGRPILRVSSEGGEPSPVTELVSPQQTTHSVPHFLPDGRRFLYFVTGSSESRGVYVSDIDGRATKRLFDADAPAIYVQSGHLLFLREGQLLAQAFDPDALLTRGDPFRVAGGVTGSIRLSASASGAVVYRTLSGDSNGRQLVWHDRSGRELDKVVYQDDASLGPSLSHDGRRVAVFRRREGNMDIWVYDRPRREWDRITSHPGDDIFPLWSVDGRQLVFSSRRGEMDLFLKQLGTPLGSGEELLLSTPGPKFPMDWSRDGRFLLYNHIDPKTALDIWVLPLEGDRKPREVVRTEFNELHPQFSPDGKWIAYQSDKTGRYEIYLQPFPGPGGERPVSIGGGTQARWSPNGRELFYIATDDKLMSVPIRFSSNGTAVEPGLPVELFVTNVGSTAINTNKQQYAVAPDGESFMLNSAVGDAIASPITVILNWRAGR